MIRDERTFWAVVISAALAAIVTGVLLSFATRPGHGEFIPALEPRFANGERVQLLMRPQPTHGEVRVTSCTPRYCEYDVLLPDGTVLRLAERELLPIRVDQRGPGR